MSLALALLLTLVGLVAALPAPSSSAASPRPYFHAPFPCGETGWHAQGRDPHGTSQNEWPLDLNWGARADDRGRTIVASADGAVTKAGGDKWNTVRVDHGGGWATIYRHMSNLRVSAGQHVTAGQALGALSDVGSPGSHHLHYEQLLNGRVVQSWLGGVAVPYLVAKGLWYLAPSTNCGNAATPAPAPMPAPVPQPVLLNGSLEIPNAAGWGRIEPSNIAVYATGGRTGAAFGATNTTGGGSVFTDATLDITAGQVLTSRIHLRASAGTSTGKVCLWGLYGNANENACTDYSVGTTWTPVDVTFGPRAAHSTARLEIYPTGGSPTVYFDDATLQHSTRLPNGSLEGSGGWGRTGSTTNFATYDNGGRTGAKFGATNAASSGSVFTDATLDITAGQVLTSRIHLRASAGTSTGKVCLWGLYGNANENACTDYSVGTTWTPVDVTFGPRAAHSTARLEIYPTPGSSTVYFDDATVVDGTIVR